MFKLLHFFRTNDGYVLPRLTSHSVNLRKIKDKLIKL